jgi:DNA-binding MarR family transcriptional regulator
MMPRHHSAPLPRGACSCGSLRKASRRISQMYDVALAPSGIKSTQFAILAEVDRGSPKGPLTLCELAAAMVMDRSTLGHNLRPLQRDRLLVLCLAPGDRRKRYVQLTPKGKATFRQAKSLWGTAERQFEKVFGKRSAAKLRAVLHGIATNDALQSAPMK